MGRVINGQMAKSGSTPLVPELKFFTFNQVCLPWSCFSAEKQKQNKNTSGLSHARFLPSCPQRGLPEGHPPSLSPVASLGEVTNAQGQRRQIERATVHSHFSFLAKCQRLLSEGKCQNNCQKEKNIPFLFSGQTKKSSCRAENGGPW